MSIIKLKLTIKQLTTKKLIKIKINLEKIQKNIKKIKKFNKIKYLIKTIKNKFN